MVPEKRNEMLKHIQKLFSKSREYGDDKVQLAMQTYEMVIIWLFYCDITQIEKRNPHRYIEITTMLYKWQLSNSAFNNGVLPLFI